MEEAEQEEEARRLKSVAEAKCKDSMFKSAVKYAKRAEHLSPNLDGISSMVTAFKILSTASKSPNPNWYKILQVEPFSHINTIKNKYKKLAFLLHPDKNSHAGSEDAFKLVNDAFRFLSDKVKRKEYDMRLRIKIQNDKIIESGVGAEVGDLSAGSSVALDKDTFCTACSSCRLLHQFERTYLGHNLVCPSCRKSFKAVEIGSSESAKLRTSERLKNSSYASKGKMGSEGVELRANRKRTGAANGTNSGNGCGDQGGWKLKRMSSVGEVMERSKPNKAKSGDDMMTLAEMRSELRKMKLEKLKENVKDKMDRKDEREKKDKRLRKAKNLQIESRAKNLQIESRSCLERIEDLGGDKIMAVGDSDFYNFDKDRVERSFKKGEVWAVYDDDDGMPRHYGLIDEVVSINPFEVNISWLDVEKNGDELVSSLEKMGFHVSCGRFKVARKTCCYALNIFSHVVDCGRAAREIYHIYPNKGSVWALYREAALDGIQDKRSYDIVVFLTSYGEMQGLSMGYLDKVAGFKTLFQRREIGSHAIRWLQKNDIIRLVSHQIPARKLSGEEAPDQLKECWELDPASLPPDLLTIGWGR